MEKFEKKNHHYVPQFWQRGFCGSNDLLYGKFKDGIRLVSPRKIMQRDWLYTVFDTEWNASDKLEDALSKVEGAHAKLLQYLRQPGYVGTEKDRHLLCEVLALQAVRHPDILGRGLRLSREFGALLAQVHDLTQDEFKQELAVLGVIGEHAQACYRVAICATSEELARQAEELLALSPQSPELSEQRALLAIAQVEQMLQKMELWLLDAPSSTAYVLGDTPIPQSNLSQGFSVPLSSSLAVLAYPALAPQATLARRVASEAEVAAINRTQNENALHVVIGQSESLLRSL